MIITISGMPGSGKSTVGKMLAKKLGYTFYSMGDLRGKMATERGMTIDELNKLGETESWTDHDVDAYQKKLGAQDDNLILDGRLSWYFIPHSFKVFLTVDTQEAARRIFKTKRGDEKPAGSEEELEQRLKERALSDNRRYRALYGVRFDDPALYNLVIDTTNTSPQKTVRLILTALQNN